MTDTVEPVYLPFLQQQLLDRCNTREQIAGTGAVYALEAKLKAHYGKRYCLTTSNATTALLATALAADLRGKEILTSPLNWGGSAGPFALLGNTIGIAALRPDDLNIDPLWLCECVSDLTTALLVNDQNGAAADGRMIRTFCEERGMLYISDSASSLGSVDRWGHVAGYHAHVVITSFGADKALTAGEAGAVLTNDESIYERLLLAAAHPSRQRKELGVYNPATPLNGRIHPLAAQLLVDSWGAQMHRLRASNKRIAKVLRGLHLRYDVERFVFPSVVCTFKNALLRVRAGCEPEHTPVELSFLNEQPQVGPWPVQYRVSPAAQANMTALRAVRYVPISGLMEKRWHTC